MNFKSMKVLFKNRQYLIVLFIGFISIGLLNTLLSMVESILEPKGMMTLSGVAGVMFIAAGIVGAVVVPIFSDKIKKRMVLIKTGILSLSILLALLAFVDNTAMVMVIYGVIGFLVMGLAPILFQHGAEAAYPFKRRNFVRNDHAYGTGFRYHLCIGVRADQRIQRFMEHVVPAFLCWLSSCLQCLK